MIDTQHVASQASGGHRKTFNDATLSNFFKLLTMGSRYSPVVIGTIVGGGALESAEILLPEADQEQAGYISEMVSLLN